MKMFFASALSEDGFITDYPELFSPDKIHSLFILKGASGVGKSTLMRKVAAYAEKNGLAVEYVLCSSDPSSLDGIVVGSTVAVIDGTSPHVTDPVCPGAFDRIINLGEFWDEEKLVPAREKLLLLSDRKAEHYREVYTLLAAHGKLREMREALTLPALDAQKTARCLKRVRNKYLQDAKPGEALLRRREALNCVVQDTTVSQTVRVTGRREERDIFMKRLFADVVSRGYACEYSDRVPDTENIGSIRFSNGTEITQFDGEGGETLCVSRLFDRAAMRSTRVKRNCLRGMIDGVLSQARRELAAAFEIHSEIEKIYIGAMDFASLDEFTEEICLKTVRDAYK